MRQRLGFSWEAVLAKRKPFVRSWRALKDGPNAGYSSFAYMRDRQYARNAEHYVRALLLIQQDLQSLFEYVEPSEESKSTYSYRIHALLMRTCIEIEANFKAILEENIFTAPARLNMSHYRKVDATHHLSSYQLMLPIWNGEPPIMAPFAPWKVHRGLPTPQGGFPQGSGVSLPWYAAYNASKHDRHQEFKKANFDTLISAVGALLILVASQFRDQDFSAGHELVTFGAWDFHPMSPSTGGLFRITYPNDWPDDELYEFNWANLESSEDRFDRIDFDAIPV